MLILCRLLRDSLNRLYVYQKQGRVVNYVKWSLNKANLHLQFITKDAKDVVFLMKHSLWESYKDEEGNLEFERSQHGTGMSRGRVDPKK